MVDVTSAPGRQITPGHNVALLDKANTVDEWAWYAGQAIEDRW